MIFNPDYDDTTRTIVLPISGRIFGPTPELQGAGVVDTTITIPATEAGDLAFAAFQLQNADVLSGISNVWRNAITQSPGLISLSVLGYEFIDPAGVFSLTGLNSSPFTLNGNQSQSFNIGFAPTNPGTYTATLRILTDMNAPVGMAGDYIPITISATAVPEPTSLLLVCSVLGLSLQRRRRKAM